MTPDTITEIPLDQFVESPFNPRRIFAGLQELADNIVAEGRIHEPLLVRLRTGDGVSGYELVFGHRRLRAAELAGLATVPCMVRALTDREARSAQVAENLQRDDVHPLEEAEAFRVMLDAGDATADELAARFGRSRSYVYGRLKLLQACPQVRDACLAGTIGSEVALLIARLRTPELQAKALAAIASQWRAKMQDGGKDSYRIIRDLLVERFTLELKGAMFDPADATLLPDAGVCTACPKRAGNAPEFADVAADKKENKYDRQPAGPDVCTDPDCFAAKKAAHLKRAVAALAAKGKTVIDGNKARQAVSATGEVKGAYVALKDVREQLKKAGDKGATPAIVTIQDPRSGKTFEAVKREDLAAAGVKLKAPPAGQQANEQARQRAAEEQRKKNEARCKTESAHRADLLQRVRTAAAARPRDAFDLGLVATAALRGVDYEARATITSLWGERTYEALGKRVGSLSVGQLTTLLLDIAFVPQVAVNRHWDLNHKPEALLAAAKHYGVPLLAPAIAGDKVEELEA